MALTPQLPAIPKPEDRVTGSRHGRRLPRGAAVAREEGDRAAHARELDEMEREPPPAVCS
eukprot:gene31894-54907_t